MCHAFRYPWIRMAELETEIIFIYIYNYGKKIFFNGYDN